MRSYQLFCSINSHQTYTFCSSFLLAFLVYYSIKLPLDFKKATFGLCQFRFVYLIHIRECNDSASIFCFFKLTRFMQETFFEMFKILNKFSSSFFLILRVEINCQRVFWLLLHLSIPPLPNWTRFERGTLHPVLPVFSQLDLEIWSDPIVFFLMFCILHAFPCK